MHSRLYFALCFAVILFAVGCDPAPSKAQVIGSYSGSLNGATETLVLSADGTFAQTIRLPSGRKITHAGKWTLKHKGVTLDRYMRFYSEEKNGALVQTREVWGVIFLWGANMLIRDFESGYYTLRKS